MMLLLPKQLIKSFLKVDDSGVEVVHQESEGTVRMSHQAETVVEKDECKTVNSDDRIDDWIDAPINFGLLYQPKHAWLFQEEACDSHINTEIVEVVDSQTHDVFKWDVIVNHIPEKKPTKYDNIGVHFPKGLTDPALDITPSTCLLETRRVMRR